MRIIDYEFELTSRSDRVEIFPFFDTHIGKANCAEDAIKKQVQEIIRRRDEKKRKVGVIFGGDICDVIKPQDIRFDFNSLANWLLEGDAVEVKEKLNDIAKAQIERASEIFWPIREHIIGAIEANHDSVVRKRYNHDTHKGLCARLGIEDLGTSAIIRLRFVRRSNASKPPARYAAIYVRHGYGGGRTAGAEPNKIARMMQDGVTADCDVCLTGHTHTYCEGEPIPMLYLPRRRGLPERRFQRYRYGVNPGCWLYSHAGGYEEEKCYPSKAMMTVKIVIWPFWSTSAWEEGKKRHIEFPKVEIRKYPIL